MHFYDKLISSIEFVSCWIKNFPLDVLLGVVQNADLDLRTFEDMESSGSEMSGQLLVKWTEDSFWDEIQEAQHVHTQRSKHWSFYKES